MSRESPKPAPDPGEIMMKLAQAFLSPRPRRQEPSKELSHEVLNKSEQKYRTLVEQIPAVTFLASFDEELNEVYVSPQIESLLGYSQEEWLSDPVLWYQRLHPEDKDRWNREFAHTVSSGAPFRSIYRFVAKDGRVVWIHGEARIAYDPGGAPLFIQGVGFDVTDLKESEEKLKQSNEDLEQFAYVASHDLREPLRIVESYTQLLEKKYKGRLDDGADNMISTITNGTKRMRILVEGLLDYARLGRKNAEDAVDFNMIFRDVLSNLQVAAEEAGAKITAGQLPVVKGRRGDLLRLLQNLLQNAIKFRFPDRKPQIHVSAAAKGIEWIFAVRDNGIGIEPHYLPKLFRIFERLHDRDKYSGEGMGLAIVRKVAEQHGGRAWVESRFGEGSTFFFSLPKRSV